MAVKLAILALKLVPLAIWGWRRLTLGASANFSGLPSSTLQQIHNTLARQMSASPARNMAGPSKLGCNASLSAAGILS